MSEKLTRSHNVIGEGPYDERTVGAGCYRTLKDTTKPCVGSVASCGHSLALVTGLPEVTIE